MLLDLFPQYFNIEIKNTNLCLFFNFNKLSLKCIARRLHLFKYPIRKMLYQVETEVSDPTPEKPGLASARLPGLQNCRGAAWKRGAATLQPTTAGSNSPSSTRGMRRERSKSILSCGGNDTACGRFIHRDISK